MSTSIIRSTTSQSTRYLIVFTRLVDPIPHLIDLEKIPRNRTSDLMVSKHADYLTNEMVYY
jgi:hypothetical protein